MLDSGLERTLKSIILTPEIQHVNSVISSTFSCEDHLVEFTSISSSLIIDFIIKSSGKGNIYENTINTLPIGIDEKYHERLFIRTLLLNCLNEYYSPLWKSQWKDNYNKCNWSRKDNRLLKFSELNPNWVVSKKLINDFERRLALVEIDVIVSIAFGLSLEELILLYTVQFPVLQQNDNDTWYDQKGNIVFTCSKGLTGVGVDRPIWNTIRDLNEGESYEHTIEKSELYHGEKVTYYAPFEKCDRVEDYKVAWAHFEKIFNQN